METSFILDAFSETIPTKTDLYKLTLQFILTNRSVDSSEINFGKLCISCVPFKIDHSVLLTNIKSSKHSKTKATVCLFYGNIYTFSNKIIEIYNSSVTPTSETLINNQGLISPRMWWNLKSCLSKLPLEIDNPLRFGIAGIEVEGLDGSVSRIEMRNVNRYISRNRIRILA